MSGGDYILVDGTTGGAVILVQEIQGPQGAAGTAVANILSITSSGTYAAVAGASYYINLNACGGNVTLTTGALLTAGIGSGFYVKLIVSVGVSYTCTISPMVAGSHIEAVYPPTGPSLPGTLTTSMVLSVVGEDALLRNVDGTNLWSSSF